MNATGDPNAIDPTRGVHDASTRLNARCALWAETMVQVTGNSSFYGTVYERHGGADAPWERTMEWCPCSKWPCECTSCECFVRGCDTTTASVIAEEEQNSQLGVLWGIFALIVTCGLCMVLWLKRQKMLKPGTREFTRSIVDLTPKEEKLKEFMKNMAPPPGTCVVQSPSPGTEPHISIAIKEEETDAR